MADLLLEIGTEEMPAALMGEAIAQLQTRAGRLLQDERLVHQGLGVYATPRRLVLYVTGLAEMQPDREELVRGPSAAAAFDAEGAPTRAAFGFARSQGVAVEDLQVMDTPGGRYVFARRVEHGRGAREVLAEGLPRMICGMEFSRSMRWGDQDMRFIRPIRWIVCLLDAEVVPFEIGGIKAGRLTVGHRVLSEGPIETPTAQDYFRLIEEKGRVIVDHRRRLEEVRRQVEAVAAGLGGRALIDEDLLDEVNFLVEYPTAFAGRFAEHYLRLPREVLITPMERHQRYFPVEGPDGCLLPAFIGVRNGGDHRMDIVVAGNEKVLRARLEDARFFFEEDRRQPLEAYVEKLRGVTFQVRLGTMYEKVERIGRLAEWIVSELARRGSEGSAAEAASGQPGWGGPELSRVVRRAAWLCKADLATSMVYEFPELQGVMGREYALLSGEDQAVAQAIFEHLLPRHAGDRLPEGLAGAVLSVADKADTLAGCFAAGIQPTGSQDPYGLRRQALGVIRTLRHRLPWVAVSELLRAALAGYEGQAGLAPEEREAAFPALMEFFLGRVRVLLDEAGFTHEVVEGVLAAGFDQPADVWDRASALAAAVGTPAFSDAVTVARRAGNLAGKANNRDVDPSLFKEDEEAALWEAVGGARPIIENAAQNRDFLAYFQGVASLRRVLDAFLDRVLVMVDDENVRQNRLALLAEVSRLAGMVADLRHFTVIERGHE